MTWTRSLYDQWEKLFGIQFCASFSSLSTSTQEFISVSYEEDGLEPLTKNFFINIDMLTLHECLPKDYDMREMRRHWPLDCFETCMLLMHASLAATDWH